MDQIVWFRYLTLTKAKFSLFFAVAVRFSVIFAIAPFVGDRLVPPMVKVLLSLAVTIALFPTLVSSGYLKPFDALVWGSSAGSLIGTLSNGK